MKVAINKCYGGFGLSYEAVMRYGELIGIKLYPYINEFNSNRYVLYSGTGKYMWLCYFTKPLIDDKYDNDSYFRENDIKRNDLNLIKVIEELGEKANGQHAKIKIVEIPDDIEWEIDEYDGMETIHEIHASWG